MTNKKQWQGMTGNSKGRKWPTKNNDGEWQTTNNDREWQATTMAGNDKQQTMTGNDRQQQWQEMTNNKQWQGMTGNSKGNYLSVFSNVCLTTCKCELTLHYDCSMNSFCQTR
jgi:hypothetical protein